MQYQEQTEEQTLRRQIVEMELDQHKDTLAEKVRAISEKDLVIETQRFLLSCISGEAQELFSIGPDSSWIPAKADM